MSGLGNKRVLVCIRRRLGCRYFIGDFKDERYLPEHHALLVGNSNRHFAPESLLTPDGRRVNWPSFFGGETWGVDASCRAPGGCVSSYPGMPGRGRFGRD